MKIAQIAPPWFAVPPTGYGGIELVVAILADGLAERGHDVTLFASGGSRSKAHVVSPLVDPPDPALLGNVWFDAYHATASYLQITDDFDVVHDHSGIIGPGMGALRAGHPPVVHTLHGPWTEPSRRFYALLAGYIQIVAISEAQKADNPDIRYAGVVHNGIELDGYPFREDKDDFLVYIGRANPDKGPTLAIEVARRAALPLAMVIKKNEPFERGTGTRSSRRSSTTKSRSSRRSRTSRRPTSSAARAMVFPIQWPEPFGLVMAEAMACGTPVVACPAGAAVELVENGVTGYLRDSIDDLVDAVASISNCSPAACRERVATMFSADSMLDGYERIYEELVPG